MKQTMKKVLCILLALLLLASLCACNEKPGEASQGTGNGVRVMTLNGTTGFGMAGLMHNAANGEAEQEYSISVETDPSNITAALINGSVDIAALPTNAASVVYNKTEGAVQVLALNTRGVLYMVSDGSISENALLGQTVYVPAQNPTHIFSYLCKANGLAVGEDVFIDNTYAQPAELRAAVVAGKAPLAVLPEPMLSMACAENEAIKVEMNLTEEWDKVAPEGSLVQGCVVVRKDYAEQNPEKVATFLKEYEASIALCSQNEGKAAEYIVEAEIFANAQVVQTALPQCNLCFVTGEEMRTQLSQYLELISQVDAQSIGGTVPADDFYYIP